MQRLRNLVLFLLVAITLPTMADAPAAIKISFSCAPATSFQSWIDRDFLEIQNVENPPLKTLLELRMVRRGRLALIVGQRIAITPVIDWKAGQEKNVALIVLSNAARLEIDGKTWLTLDNAAIGNIEKTCTWTKQVADGMKINGDVKISSADTFKPASLFDLGTNAKFKKLLSLDRKIISKVELFSPKLSCRGSTTQARMLQSIARVSLDSLWARLYNKKIRWFDKYLRELEQLEARLGQADTLVIELPNNARGPWLGSEDHNLYFGGIGWSMGCYIPDFSAMGLNLIATSVWPERVYDKTGKLYDDQMKNSILPQLKLAEKYGVKVDMLVSPYTPTWMLKKYPQWDGLTAGHGMDVSVLEKSLQAKGRVAGHGFLKASISHPEYRKMCKEYLDYILPYMKNKPALAAICLGNEIQFEDYSIEFQRGFQDFLKGKYKTIAAVNSSWHSSYKSFENIFMDRKTGLDRTNVNRFWDWVNYNWQQGNDYISYLNGITKKHLPAIPTHTKTLPYEFALPWMKPGSEGRNFYDYADGVDRMSLVRMSDFAGTDSWADNFRGEGPLSTNTVYQAMYFELLRHYKNPPAAIYDSEWHIIDTRSPMPPRYVSAVMQIDVLHGLRAGAIWVSHPLIDNADFVSSPRLLEEIARASVFMRTNQKSFLALADRPRPIGILYSPYAKYFSGDKYTLALRRVFEVGLYTGVGVRMIDGRQLAQGQYVDIKGLIVLGDFAIQPETIKAIEKYQNAGNEVFQLGSGAFKLVNASHEKFPKELPELLAAYEKMIWNLKLTPVVKVTGPNGETLEGIEWHCAKNDYGKWLVFIANISRKTAELKIAGSGKLKDIKTGQMVSGAIKLKVWETFVGYFE